MRTPPENANGPCQGAAAVVAIRINPLPHTLSQGTNQERRTAPQPRTEFPRPLIAPDAFSGVAHFEKPARGVRERDDDYPMVFRINTNRRVIRCRDNIQFIYQKRTKGGRWQDLGYFRDTRVMFERIATDIIGG